MRSQRWAVLISGTGSNLQSLLDRAYDPLPLKVYSSKSQAAGLSKARRMGIPVEVLPKVIDWEVLDRDLRSHRIQKIFLLGFMKLLPASFVDQWRDQIVNLHPSLLPAYPGLHSFEKAWADGAPLGATLHIVTPELDAGPVLRQRKFSRSGDQSWDRLKLSFTEQTLVQEVFDDPRF